MNSTKKMKFTREPETGCLSEQDAKRYFTVVGFGVFALMLLFYLGSTALSAFLWRVSPSLFQVPFVSHAVSLFGLYLLGVPAFYLIIRRLPRGIPGGQSVSGGDLFGGLGLAVLMMMVGNYMGQWLMAILENAMGSVQQNPVEMATLGVDWWINLIFMALIPCVLEELVFRKLLCDRLLPLGEGYAVVISAVTFALVHGNFYQFFYALAVGLLLATVYVKTGKIWITMLYHGAVNVLGGVVAPFLLDRLSPVLTEEALEKMNELMNAGDAAALSEWLTPYMGPMMGLLFYEGIVLAATVGGFVYFWRRGRKIRFQSGLLPVPRSCRVSAVFLNVGTAVALTLFAGIFLLSLL